MIKRENTISNLETNIKWIEDIPSHQFPGWGNVTMSMRDALELLKEQEAKTPNLMQDAKGIWCVCPNCGYILRSVVYNLMETDKVKSGFHFPNFCEMCGQAVKWE